MGALRFVEQYKILQSQHFADGRRIFPPSSSPSCQDLKRIYHCHHFIKENGILIQKVWKGNNSWLQTLCKSLWNSYQWCECSDLSGRTWVQLPCRGLGPLHGRDRRLPGREAGENREGTACPTHTAFGSFLSRPLGFQEFTHLRLLSPKGFEGRGKFSNFLKVTSLVEPEMKCRSSEP